MKLGLRILPVAFLLAIAAGCSDSSDTLTLDEYFAEVSAIMADVLAQSDALRDVLPEHRRTSPDDPWPLIDANVPLLKDLFAEIPGIFGDAVDRLKALDPPSEVEDAHNDFTDAGEKLVVAYEAQSDSIQDVETAAEILTLISTEPSFFDAATAFVNACYELEDIGEANGFPYSHVCGDDGDH